ncbi:hypothetical protein [Adlercreutzia muris]|uniref:hypothetical protein n=1 Tax=Adlercreutzia muris TaxID=1796610 RepID=UPI0013661586|nr:hypothetical protein [Adlercreutzia muris]NCA32195.1 hypothetical protein [Adlercreutzia muris]
MTEEAFITNISASLQKQAEIAYSIKIDNAHIPFYHVPFDFFCEEYTTLWKKYNLALFRSLQLYIRYLKQLLAWKEVLPKANSDAAPTLTMDYLHPVFRSICDIPTTFKDQLLRAATKLSRVSTGDFELISWKHEDRSKKWPKEMERATLADVDLLPLCELVTEDLYESDTAKHFADLHGRFMHDAHPTLLEGMGDARQDSIGAIVYCSEEPLALNAELEALFRHLPLLSRSYQAFNEYAHSKYQLLPHRINLENTTRTS